MLKKWLLSTSILLPAIVVLAKFTSFFAIMPEVASTSLSGSYWQSLVPGRADFLPTLLSGGQLAAVGPVLVVFVVCWYLFIRRSNSITIRQVAAKSRDIHDWLQKWSHSEEFGPPRGGASIVDRARIVFRRLDRLLSTVDPRRRTILYVVKLMLWYWPYARKIIIYQMVEDDIDPPFEDWPSPAGGLQEMVPGQARVLDAALDFAAAFTNGGMAHVGHYYMYHAIWGLFLGCGLGIILGGFAAMLTIGWLGPGAGLYLSSFSLAAVAGIVPAKVWQLLPRNTGADTASPPSPTQHRPS